MRLPLAAHSLKSMKKNINIVCISLHSEGSADYGRKKIQNSTENPKIQKKYQDQIEKTLL